MDPRPISRQYDSFRPPQSDCGKDSLLSTQGKHRHDRTAIFNQNFFIGGGENLDKDDFYNLVIKLDQNFSDKHHIFFRHASNDRTEMRSTNGLKGVAEDGPLPLKRVNDAYVIDWVGILRPTLIANFRISFNRYLDPSYG